MAGEMKAFKAPSVRERKQTRIERARKREMVNVRVRETDDECHSVTDGDGQIVIMRINQGSLHSVDSSRGSRFCTF